MIIKLNKDNIYNYLEIDSNIFEKDSELTYLNEPIYILHFPNAGKACISKGAGIKKINEYDIKHFCNTQSGSSGGPILSLITNKVIGIHKGYIITGFNIGTFLKYPLNELNINKLNQNYIIAEIYIEENDINKEIRILNSFDEYMRNDFKLETDLTFWSPLEIGMLERFMNGKEINKCEIKINDEVIPFNYFHKFKKQGKNIIKYYFKNYLTDTSLMFYKCKSLKNIDLSNFNTQSVTNMSYMFYGCSSLTKKNVITNDNGIFEEL